MTDQRHTRAEIVAIKVSKYSTEELREMIKVYVTRKEFGNPEGADENDPEYEGGHLFDLRMGANEKENCKTCNQPITSCIGHFGGIEIPIPFLTKIDSDLKVLSMILKAFCPICRRCQDCENVSQSGSKTCEKCKSTKMCPKLLYNDVDFRKVINLNYQNKLTALTSMDKKCPYHSNYKFKKIKSNENFVVLTRDKKSENDKVYEPDDLRNFLKLLPTKDLELLGVYSRPENMIIDIIPVLPNYLRLPYVPDDGIPVEQGTNSLYKRIIDTRNELSKLLSGRVGMEKKGKKKKSVEKEKSGMEERKVKLLEDIRTQHNDLIFSSDTKNNTKSYKRIIDKKEGLIRKNVHGKRGNYCARSVVVPDPTLNIYEVGLPEKIAKELTTEEYITEFNLKEMQYLLETGEVKSLKRQRVEKMSNELPDNILPFDDVFIQKVIDSENLNEVKKIQRIKEIIRGDRKEDVETGIQLGDQVTYAILYQDLTESDKQFVVGYLIKSNNMMISSLGKDVIRKIKLKPNDLIHRFLRNGDVVTVNRNPTLHKNSILALIVEIRDGYCIRMPVQLCTGYGMDFNHQSPTVGCHIGCGKYQYGETL